jgi:surface antigen
MGYAGGTIACALLLGLSLMGCASSDDEADNAGAPVRMASALPRESGQNRVEEQPGLAALQCVPYAREHSQVKLYGDAYTWWDQADGKYARGSAPAAGAVMVLFHYAGPAHGHVAVVRRVVSAREIRVDHANWLDDGSIYVNDPVVDVSADNDWSQIKVWNIKTGGWGLKIYPVQGFIGGTPGGEEAPAPDARIARAEPRPQPRPQPPASIPPARALPAGGDSHALTAEDLAIPDGE